MPNALARLVLATSLMACGGDDPLGPGAGDDPGSGTSTLSIDADVDATPQIANAAAAADFETSFEVRVDKAGVPVTTGEVTIVSLGGSAALAYDSADGGRWRGSQAGYHEVYELTVAAGEDGVEGVRVDGPALHAFTAPVGGATVDATVPLEISWTRGEVAEAASLKTREIDALEIADTGAYTLAVGSLKSKETELEEEELRLTRSARLTPAGAVAGSEMRVRVTNRLDLLVAPTAP